MADYVITLRATDENGAYTHDPGPTKFLRLPDNQTDYARATVLSSGDWANEVQAISGRARDATGVLRGDVLVFIHGYNNTIADILHRQQVLRAGLAAHGYHGAIVSFDWPCDDVTLAYLPDRERASQTAVQLVKDCIVLLARRQGLGGCDVNVHLLAHSAGAFVVREAFDDADNRNAVAGINWTVSQLAVIAGDVSSGCMTAVDSRSDSLYRHCIRLTNYSNPYDEALQLSNVKRVGVAPRVGRVGLPDAIPDSALNVECGEYFKTLVMPANPDGTWSHSWYFMDPVFQGDLAETLKGDLDRSVFPTRSLVSTGRFRLGAAPARV